ncbi:hypothetical protein GY45DRAFT_1370005 [Cubamyces sp. BRFM 1775]|nr:hypothetical protein GY45DRAFT_1370005 [Cubamyces sp. BRFM 1775]
MPNQSHTVKVDASDMSRFANYSVLQYAPLEDISVEFLFNGTRISVFGTIRPPTASYAPLPVTKYSLIGWDWGGIPAMNPYQAPNVTMPQNNVNFWSSQEMPYKEYILTINVTTATANMPFCLDCVTIEVPGLDPSANTTSSTATSTTRRRRWSHGSTAPVGAIVGASIGGIALIAAALFVLLRWYRRRVSVPPAYDYGPLAAAQQGAPP